MKTCGICGRPVTSTEICFRPSFTDSDEVAAGCYRLGYARVTAERDSLECQLRLLIESLPAAPSTKEGETCSFPRCSFRGGYPGHTHPANDPDSIVTTPTPPTKGAP